MKGNFNAIITSEGIIIAKWNRVRILLTAAVKLDEILSQKFITNMKGLNEKKNTMKEERPYANKFDA